MRFKRGEQFLSTDLLYNTLANIVKWSTLIIDKRYALISAIWYGLNSSSGLSAFVLEDLPLIWAALMSSQRVEQLLSTDWWYITLLKFVKYSIVLTEKGSHKRYATLTNLAVVWELCSLRIFPWAELCWWALKDQSSWCLEIDRILCFLILLNWAHCWSTRVATGDMRGSHL